DLGNDPITGKILRFDNASASASIFFDAAANPQKQSLTDWLAYDATANQMGQPFDKFNVASYRPDSNVSDLKLRFFYQRNDGSGPLRLSLSKLERSFIAQIEPRKVSLYQRINDGSETLLKSVDIGSDC